MAVTKVGDILRRCKKVLQEVTQNGTRWANEELLDWLNESYQAITGIKPDASSVNGEIVCVLGTKQQIPADGLMLLDVVRNVGGDGMAVIRTSRAALDSTRRRWHGEEPQAEVEQFIFDDQDPRHFYVYPPALATVRLEIIYSSVPQPHETAQATENSQEVIRLPDAYAPAMVDYILARAYAKDAEHAANLQRSSMHMQAWQAALGLKGQVDVAVSPNADGRPGMTYQELIEHLLPELPGVLIASVRDAVGWAVREFCKDADVWLVELPVVAGSNTLDAGDDLEPLRVRGVLQGGNPLPARMYEQPAARTLIVNSDLQGLVAQVAVRPRSIAYQGLAEDFVSEHQDALASGALMRLYAQPEKPWSNPQLANDQHRIFLACCAHARQRAVLGYATGGRQYRVPRFT